MKQFVCEICGGKHLAKQDGQFVCQDCGTIYQQEDARRLMVEVDQPAPLPEPVAEAASTPESVSAMPTSVSAPMSEPIPTFAPAPEPTFQPGTGTVSPSAKPLQTSSLYKWFFLAAGVLLCFFAGGVIFPGIEYLIYDHYYDHYHYHDIGIFHVIYVIFSRITAIAPAVAALLLALHFHKPVEKSRLTIGAIACCVIGVVASLLSIILHDYSNYDPCDSCLLVVICFEILPFLLLFLVAVFGVRLQKSTIILVASGVATLLSIVTILLSIIAIILESAITYEYFIALYYSIANLVFSLALLISGILSVRSKRKGVSYKSSIDGSSGTPIDSFAISYRSPAVCIILSFLTLGIYGIYWLYCMTEDTNYVSGESKTTSGGTVILLIIVTCGIYMWYWHYKRGEYLDRAKTRCGIPSSNSGVLYLLLSFFGLSVVSYCLIQSELNKLSNQN